MGSGPVKSMFNIVIFLILLVIVFKLVKIAIGLIFPVAIIGIGGYFGLKYLKEHN